MLHKHPPGAARPGEARAPRESPTARRSRARERPPPQRRRRPPPPRRPDPAPACRPATGARPKRRRRPLPAPAEQRTALGGSCWPPPWAPARATTVRWPARDGRDARARARAASPGSWPYAGATPHRVRPRRRRGRQTRQTAVSVRACPFSSGPPYGSTCVGLLGTGACCGPVLSCVRVVGRPARSPRSGAFAFCGAFYPDGVIDSITARTRSLCRRSARWRSPSAFGGTAVCSTSSPPSSSRQTSSRRQLRSNPASSHLDDTPSLSPRRPPFHRIRSDNRGERFGTPASGRRAGAVFDRGNR